MRLQTNESNKLIKTKSKMKNQSKEIVEVLTIQNQRYCISEIR